MRPPVPETLIDNHKINGAENWGKTDRDNIENTAALMIVLYFNIWPLDIANICKASNTKSAQCQQMCI